MPLLAGTASEEVARPDSPTLSKRRSASRHVGLPMPPVDEDDLHEILPRETPPGPLARAAPAPESDATAGLMTALPNGETIGSLIVGGLTGFLGSMAGVGGGPFCVPLLGWLLGLGHKACVGTSILCGLTTLTVGGIATFFFAHDTLQLSLLPITVLAAVAPVFGYMSARWSNTVSPLFLKKVFAGFLLFCALQIMYGLAYSPTGVEGHWTYALKGSTHVYEIEGSDGQLAFRTHSYGGVLRKIDATPSPGGRREAPPEGFEKGWVSSLSRLDDGLTLAELAHMSSAAHAARNVTGLMWVKVLDRGLAMETRYQSYYPEEHWNDPVTATRKKAWYADQIAQTVASDFGNVGFHMLIALVAGTASGLLGIAGGSVVVPLMSLTGAYPWQTIVATSLLSMIPTSMTTCYTHHLNGNVEMRLAPGLISGTVMGAYAGSTLMAVVSEPARKAACAGVLLFTAFIMIYQSTKHLFVKPKGAEGALAGRGHLIRVACISAAFLSCAAVIKERVFNQPELSNDRLLTFLNAVNWLVFAGADWHFTFNNCVAPNAAEEPKENRSLKLFYGLLVAIIAAEGQFLSLARGSLSKELLTGGKATLLLFVLSLRIAVGWLCSEHGDRITRVPTAREWWGAVGVCTGLALFAVAGVHLHTSRDNDPSGFIALAVALCLEASMYVVEDLFVFGRHKAAVVEVLWGMAVWWVPVSFFLLGRASLLSSHWVFLQREWRFPTLALAYSVCNYIGTKYVLQIVQEYGAATAVVAQAVRKVATLVITLSLFPTAVTLLQTVGFAVTCGSIYVYLSFMPPGAKLGGLAVGDERQD